MLLNEDEDIEIALMMAFPMSADQIAKSARGRELASTLKRLQIGEPVQSIRVDSRIAAELSRETSPCTAIQKARRSLVARVSGFARALLGTRCSPEVLMNRQPAHKSDRDAS